MEKFNTKKFFGSHAFSSFMATISAIILGMLLGFIIMIFANPSNAIAGFGYILTGGMMRIQDVLYYAIPIIMTGLAVGFAFKMGMFNIGASGQYTMGMFFAMYVCFMFELPPIIHCTACVLAGMVGGALWGIIPGIFKAYLNVNEVITSIMFNYIGMYLVDMMIQSNAAMYVASKTRTAYLPESAQLMSLGIKGSSLNVAIIAAVLIAIALYIVLNKTTFGYELKATGLNANAAVYAGMSGKRNIVITMAISGAMAGLGGAFAILAPSVIQGSSMTYEPINIVTQAGFTGIAVALLGNSNPIAIIFTAFFVSYIYRGGTLASLAGFNPDIIDVVIAIIIYFSAFSALLGTAVKGKAAKLFGHGDDIKPNANAETEQDTAVTFEESEEV